MASESDSTEPQSIFDRLIGSRNRDFSLFIPFLLGYSHPGLPRPDPDTHRIILINPVTQTTVVLQGAPRLDAPPPASKSAIEAMPRVEIREGEEGACVICLEEWESNGESVKEMPCKHRFHGDCIENWLRLHGSCPVCRLKMPPEEEVAGKKAGDGGELPQEVWVRFSFGSDRTVENDSVVDHSDRTVGNDSVDQSSTVVNSNRTVGRESEC